MIAVCGRAALVNLYIYPTLLNNVMGLSIRACFLSLPLCFELSYERKITHS